MVNFEGFITFVPTSTVRVASVSCLDTWSKLFIYYYANKNRNLHCETFTSETVHLIDIKQVNRFDV
jgi:hypothetical protein